MEKSRTGFYSKVRPYLNLRENFYDLAKITVASSIIDYFWIGLEEDHIIDAPLKSALSGAGILDGYFRTRDEDENQKIRSRRGAARCLTVGLLVGGTKLLSSEHTGLESYMIDVFDSTLRYGVPCLIAWLVRGGPNMGGGGGDDENEPMDTPPVQPEKKDEPNLDDPDIPKPIADRMKSRNLF